VEPYGTAIFCDDIRFEQQGTISLIGCYGSDMVVSTKLPTAIPKFCIFVQLRLPIDIERVQPKLRIYVPGDPIDKPSFEHIMPPIPDVPSDPSNWGEDEDIQRLIGISYPLMYRPFPIISAGNLKVRAVIGNKIIKVGALKVVQGAAL
jgi:hypothetical protein